MKIDLTPDEAAEIRTAVLDNLREVKSLLNYSIICPVGETVLKRWFHRKTLLTVILDKLEATANAECLTCADMACTVCAAMKGGTDNANHHLD